MNKVKNSSFTVLSVIFLALILALMGYFLINRNLKSTQQPYSVQDLTIDTSEKNIQKGIKKLTDRQIHYAGVNDQAVAKNEPILLRNPESNEDIYIQYIITDEETGNIIFDSDLITSDTSVEWIPSDTLDVGEHHLSFSQHPYYRVEKDKWLPLNVGNNHVTIYVLD